MDENISPLISSLASPPVAVPLASPVAATIICLQCHQPVPAAAYYCPNCGKQLNEPPLRTSVSTKTWIYILSVIMPLIGFLAIKYWPGIKYARSDDPKTREIGFIAIALMAISTIIIVWLTVAGINQALQSAQNSLNSAVPTGL